MVYYFPLLIMLTKMLHYRSTRSSHRVNILVVPNHVVNKYYDKANFAVDSPRLWNILITDGLRGCKSLDTFKKKPCYSRNITKYGHITVFHYVAIFVVFYYLWYSNVHGLILYVSYVVTPFIGIYFSDTGV